MCTIPFMAQAPWQNTCMNGTWKLFIEGQKIKGCININWQRKGNSLPLLPSQIAFEIRININKIMLLIKCLRKTRHYI
jgi:hypothetical protein